MIRVWYDVQEATLLDRVFLSDDSDGAPIMQLPQQQGNLQQDNEAQRQAWPGIPGSKFVASAVTILAEQKTLDLQDTSAEDYVPERCNSSRVGQSFSSCSHQP